MFQHYVLFRNPPKKGGYQKISDSDHDSDLEAVSNGESSEKTPLIDSDEKTKKKSGVLGQFFSAIRLA